MAYHASYLSPLFDNERTKELVNDFGKIVRRAKKDGFLFDGIAVRGISGISLGSIISFKHNIPLVIVRKDDESHSPYKVELDQRVFWGGTKNLLFFDDLISSGLTARTVASAVAEFDFKIPFHYLYNCCGDPFFFVRGEGKPFSECNLDNERSYSIEHINGRRVVRLRVYKEERGNPCENFCCITC